MGHYTELKVKIKLRKDTPDEVINLLKRVILDKDLGVENTLFHSEEVFTPDIQHEFFECECWYMLFLSTNWSDSLEGSVFVELDKYYQLLIHTEFKNYDQEIQKFVDWINPYLIGHKKKQYIGYWRSENYNREINIYVER